MKASGLIVTEHFVDGPRQFVRSAESRKQNAGVNAWMDEHTDERLFVEAPPKIDKKPIYVNLLHGAKFVKTADGSATFLPESSFLRIAIPDKDSQQYLYNWSAQELLMAYTAVENAAAAPQVIEDQAKPRTKVAQLKAKKFSAGQSE